jgi:hypothetical protein
MPVTGLATSRVLQALLGESTVVTGHVGTQGKAEASKKRPGR